MKAALVLVSLAAGLALATPARSEGKASEIEGRAAEAKPYRWHAHAEPRSEASTAYETEHNKYARDELDTAFQEHDIAKRGLLDDLLSTADKIIKSLILEVGKAVGEILSEATWQVTAANALVAIYPDAPPLEDCLKASKPDPCCVWKHVADEMNAAMLEANGECNDLARGAVRLAFHDPGRFSTDGAGGANGGIVLSGDCFTHRDHRGLAPTCTQVQAWYDKYKAYGVTVADLIQMAGTVATVTCPKGPRIPTFIGRDDKVEGLPDGRMPTPRDSADQIFARMAQLGFSPNEVVSLVGAHSTSRQRGFDATRVGAPQDTTPGVWDVKFYGETRTKPTEIVVFPSDENIANHDATRATWDSFVDPISGQLLWNAQFQRAMTKLGFVGVPNDKKLYECTKVLPLARP